MGKNWHYCCVIGYNHQLTEYDRHPAEERGRGVFVSILDRCVSSRVLNPVRSRLRMRQMKLDTHMDKNIGISPLKVYIRFPVTWGPFLESPGKIFKPTNKE